MTDEDVLSGSPYHLYSLQNQFNARRLSSLISRYDELSAAENERLEVLADSSAEWAELLAFVKRLFGGPDKRHALTSAADAEATVQPGAFEDLLIVTRQRLC